MSKTPVKGNKSRKDSNDKDGSINIPIKSDDGSFLSALHPKYLHTNSTSHTWPFSAVAELIDNAYDPDVNASQLFIDLKTFKGQNKSLVFTDNGNGMSPNKLYKMLSFGFCEKVAVNDHLPVGHYGNGFKSGSMRLGKDALVFTKSETRWSVGYLSQPYLEKIGSDTIIVPIVTWDPKKFTFLEKEMGGLKSLSAILTHSVVNSTAEIQEEFRGIDGTTGTRIIISNLRKQASGNKYELDFMKDYSDIRLPDDLADSDESRYKREQRQDHIPASDYSLRAYCSILYLKPRMQIILRGKKVKTTVVAKSLAKTEVDAYRPYTPSGYGKPVKIVFGFSQNKNHYGIMMYHRNRLIKPYVRVGHQQKQNALGIGVIGVIECDFLQPTHNKQDFDYTKAFRACMMGLGRKLNEYWQEKKTNKKTQPQVSEETETEQMVPDQKWVQCDNRNCLKWRMLPDSVSLESLPEKWFCKDHPIEEWRSCDIPESLEVAQESVKPYTKEVKRQLEKEKKQKRQSLRIEEKSKSEMEDIAEKNRKELESEKKKRLQQEQKAKDQEAEIQRLTQELQKSASVPANLNKQDKTGTEARPASTTPVNQSTPKPVNQSTPKPVNQATPKLVNPTSKTTPKLIIVNSASVTSATKAVSTQALVTTPNTATSSTPSSTPKTTVILNTATKTPAYPTRQSINQAIKVRLPFSGPRAVKTPLPIAPNQSTGTPIVRTILQGRNNQPGQIVRQPAPVNQQVKPATILPQNIRLPPMQVTTNLANLTTLQKTTLPKVLTVLRFTDASKTHVNLSPVTTKPIVTAKPTTTQSRPIVPNNSRGPQNSAPKVVAQSPKSRDISQQLAQIGIDAIAAQTQQDIKPTMLNKFSQPPSQSYSTAATALATQSIILTNNPKAVNNGSGPSQTRENKPLSSTPKKRANDDDIRIVNEIPAKKKRNEPNSVHVKSEVTNSSVAINKQQLGSTVNNSTSILEIAAEILDKTDKDVIDEIKKLPARSVLGLLAQRSQQLRDLRQSVCKLLGVLVPDLDLPDAGQRSLDDNTIDALLKDVLDANTETNK